MLVLGYFCAGSNTRWGREHPELSYGIPSEPHIPYTDEYLAYLDAAIRDAVGKTGIDGFMLDWLRMPTSRASNGGRWLECEKKLYAQLMNEPFPGEKELPAAKMTEYGRRAVDRAWGVIRKAAKETNPHCIVWLTCCDVNDPHIINSRALRETDWLLNEAGDLQRTADAKKMIGPHTRLITCLANWNAQDPMQIVPAALKEGIGLYGFTKPGPDSLLPLESLLSRPVGELKGDERNIAVLARAFHGASLDSIRNADGKFVEPAAGFSHGKWVEGEGDAAVLEAIDAAFESTQPSARMACLPLLYKRDWDGFVEGPPWPCWWIQNSFGPSYALMPFLGEPYATWLEHSQGLWFRLMGDGQRKDVNGFQGPDGCLCDAALRHAQRRLSSSASAIFARRAAPSGQQLDGEDRSRKAFGIGRATAIRDSTTGSSARRPAG